MKIVNFKSYLLVLKIRKNTLYTLESKHKNIDNKFNKIIKLIDNRIV